VRQSNRWRDNYNPFRGLVIGRAMLILEAADRGDFAELQLVMRKVERRFPALKGLKARRLAALEKLDWEIKVVDELPEGSTRAEAGAQQKFLRSRYELISNLTEAIGFLVTAEFRGYAILQKHRFNDGGKFDGAVRELHWLPQDQFSRNGQFGDFYYNQNSNFGIGLDACATILGEANRVGGVQLPREDFVIREVDSPLYEIALIAFVNWVMGRKDWAAFTEIFGLPNGVAIMPANIPPGMEDEYRMAAERVADGVSGALPNGSDIKFPTSGVRGEAPFKNFCDAQDCDVVLAGTGGRLAMLTADKGGLGNGPALEHAAAFDEIAQADARKINSVLQNDFDRLELAAEFPGQPALAYFELAATDRLDVAQLVTDVASLATAGFEVDVDWLSEATGYKFAGNKSEGASPDRGYGRSPSRSARIANSAPDDSNGAVPIQPAAAGPSDTAAVRNEGGAA
jgi:phage gp29-like protein